MTKNYLLIMLLSYSALSFGQTNLFPASGNVGIGTPSPVSKLSIGDYFVDGSGSNISRDILVSQNTYNNQVVAAHTIEHNLYNNYNTKYHISTLNLTGALTKRLTISGEGNLGIGTTTPSAKLHVNASLTESAVKIGSPNVQGNINVPVGSSTGGYNIDFYTWRDIQVDQIGARIRAERINSYQPNNALVQSMDLVFSTSTGGIQTELTEKLRIGSTGNVSIGTSDAKGYKLAVAGNMIAESVKVQLQSAWPDYVFKEDYKLTSLHETKKYIKENGHLPGIPSAAEVKSEGIDLGEMNKKLLQKIEELTLALINQHEKAEVQDEKINRLTLEMSELKKIINK